MFSISPYLVCFAHLPLAYHFGCALHTWSGPTQSVYISGVFCSDGVIKPATASAAAKQDMDFNRTWSPKVLELDDSCAWSVRYAQVARFDRARGVARVVYQNEAKSVYYSRPQAITII